MTTTLSDIWLETPEVADLLNCSDRHVRNELKMWNYKMENGKWKIQLLSLPQNAIDAYTVKNLPTIPELKINTEDTELIIRTYERSSKKVKAYFDKWTAILAGCEGITGSTAMRLWTREWNRDYPKMKTSPASIYRVRAQVEEHGRLSLLNDNQSSTTTVKDDWFEWFKAQYLTDNKVPASQAHRIALGKAIEAGHVKNKTNFPSQSAFLRRLHREFSPSMIAYARDGAKAFYDNHGYHIERDFSGVPAGSIWVGDTRTWDVFVRISGRDTPATAYITLFLDQRTFLPMGWHLHTSAPSTDNTLRAIRMGIETYGVPDHLYVDNGREYRNKDFSGQTRGHQICENPEHAESLANRLGIKMHFAIVRNARAKIIERMFLNIKNGFDRLFGTFKGGNVLEKPESLKKRLKQGDVIPWEEFKVLATEYLQKVYPGIQSNGKHLAGRSPAEAWNTLITEREPMRKVSVETASMLTTRIATLRVMARGIHLSNLDCTWWAEWMTVHKGKSVRLRYDPEDLRIAWCYDENSRLLGEAELTQAVGVMVDHSELVNKDKVREGVTRRKREEKTLKELFPQMKTKAAAESIRALVAAVESPEITTSLGSTLITRHDHEAKELISTRNQGTADLSVLIPIPTPESKKRFSVWDDDDEQFSNHG